MQFLFLKLLHQLIDLLVCCRKQCRTHHFPDARIRPVNPIIKILMVQNADDMIQCFFINRKSGIAGICKYFCSFLLGTFHRDSFHIDPWGQNISRLQIVKAQCAAQKTSFFFINASLFLRFLYDRKQFFRCNTLTAGRFKQTGQQLLPLPEHPVDRCQDDPKPIDHRCGKHSEFFRGFFCDALWRNFTENQYHNGDHQCGNSRAHLFSKKLYK